MTEVVVVVPVLGRPHNVAPLVASWLAAEPDPPRSRLLFVASPGDTEQIEACRDAITAPDVVRFGTLALIVAPFERRPGDFARKINHAYRHTPDPFLFQAADDVVFEAGWLEHALARAEATGAGVVGTNDMGNAAVMRGDHATHLLIRRAYIEEHGGSLDGPGVVFHEGYGHQWVDTELVELAKSRGQWAFAHNAVVRHRHPFWERTVRMDATYRLGQSTSANDKRLYARRSRAWKDAAA